MGLLLQISESKLLVTAKHVAEETLHTQNAGCTGDNNHVVALDGKWLLSNDSPDIAIHQISPRAAESLCEKNFVRILDLQTEMESPAERHSILGCPQVWSKGARLPSRGKLEEIQLISSRYHGTTSALADFDPAIHFLLYGDEKKLFGEDGQSWEFTNENGFPVDFPLDLKGISGTPVWSFSGFDGGLSPRVTGIQMRVYPQPPLIKVTKAQFLIFFIRDRLPELRPAIDLVRKN